MKEFISCFTRLGHDGRVTQKCITPHTDNPQSVVSWAEDGQRVLVTSGRAIRGPFSGWQFASARTAARAENDIARIRR